MTQPNSKAMSHEKLNQNENKSKLFIFGVGYPKTNSFGAYLQALFRIPWHLPRD
ncbi:hypothetical protein B7P43_G15094 [Cryptotermes secundus]|uniref:Uncharacterized protein n=1 Tax=Cryptotermes secundus TaxID=105785 RepID=A0A2J7QK62_9NEOP|nr:hypothetical protein B7P43_G15094 [Cryptotermes secundus]